MAAAVDGLAASIAADPLEQGRSTPPDGNGIERLTATREASRVARRRAATSGSSTPLCRCSRATARPTSGPAPA